MWSVIHYTHHCRVLVIVITTTSWWPHLVISFTSTLDTFLETSNTLWYINTIFVALLTYVTLSLSPHPLSLSLLSSLHRASKESGLHLSSPQTLCGSWEERYSYTAEIKIKVIEVFMISFSLQDSSTFETYKNLCCRASYADTLISSSTSSH